MAQGNRAPPGVDALVVVRQAELAQLDLTVTEGNDAAQSLYARCGFAVFGVQPNAIRLDGRELAKVHMGLRLR